MPRAESTNCRACGSGEARFAFTGTLLTHEVAYYECLRCGYFQTELPHWLPVAYARAINVSDTGILVRNRINARVVLGTLWLLNATNTRVVDYAGGYGLLVRLLRDHGVDAYWADRYCQNLFAVGFEHRQDPAGLLTAFEAFEHFVDPREELGRMLAIAPAVLLSTELMPDPAPAPRDWWYYGNEHGQHIGFFRARTLRMLAESRGKRFLTDGRTFHLIADRLPGEAAWRLMLRLNRLAPLMVRGRLEPRTWSDHERAASEHPR